MYMKQVKQLIKR